MAAELTYNEIIDTRESVLDIGVWKLGRFIFADGGVANNKLDMEVLLGDDKHCQRIVGYLARLVHPETDLLFGMPSGGQEFAKYIGQLLDLPVISLDKDSDSPPGEKHFSYTSPDDELAVEGAKCVTGIEDVTTKMTSTAGTLLLPGLAQKTRRIAAIWRRGMPDEERVLPDHISKRWIYQQPLPNLITKEHPFYRGFGHRAVGEFVDPKVLEAA